MATADLVDGSRREVRAPALVGVAVSGGREIVLESLGASDVRARLLDADGELVASSDDRPDDWNFRIGTLLPAGRYQLRIDPVGATSAATSVSMRERALVAASPVALGEARTLELDEGILALPLDLPAGADLVALGATASRPLSLRLERRDGERWLEVAGEEGREVRVAAPTGESDRWRARLSTLDGLPASVSWSSWGGHAPRTSESELTRGVTLSALPGIVPSFAALAVTLDRPGCFALDVSASAVQVARGVGRGFASEEALLISDGATLWLGAEAPGRLSARRTRLGVEAEVLRLAGGESARCDLADFPDGLVAVEAWSLSGQPGVRLVAPTDGGGGAVRRDRGVAIAPERALALGETSATGASRATLAMAEIWNGGREPAEIRVSARSIEALGVRVARPGGEDFRLLPGSAERLRLPEGGRATVALDRGGAARFGAAESDAPLLWAALGAANESADGAREIVVVNPTATAIAAHVEILPGVAEPPGFDAAGRLAARRSAAGSLSLELPAERAGAELRVRGARATVVGADGSVARGERLRVPPGGGVVRLEYPPGLLTAWLEPAPLLAERVAGGSESIELPARIALGDSARRFRFESDRSALLRLRAAGSGEIELRSAAGTERELFADSLRLDRPVPAGRVELTLAPLPGEPSPSVLEATLDPLLPLAEGLGEERLLAPGEARAYRFELGAEGPVGVGAASSSGNVETALYDADGVELGRGVVLWRRLAAGSYVAVLRAPESGPPVRARPALVGVTPPPGGPPAEMARAFLALASEAPEAPAGTTIGSEGAPRPVEGFAPAGSQDEDEEELE